ncbi:monovalent cation/H(+) antiporter subunit G [Halalkalibacter oceani]|uniref:Monovalent cation/H(+) antiporter subunit G n=1 Tax=Halalkalibacter oceani TaxID=1653776 RepID=A0A9X2DMH7_9BACI|nr:monovalent cation/H(+) antiporter subunit G [Halalkalibacter oceani]MCM3712765.1 monovalent cation/H(+) antiporter subunit G [Halalkalibacter oceani]
MNENEIINTIVAILVLSGTFLSLVTTIGLFRLPDIYSRAHAASKSATLGVMLILLGALVYFYQDHGLDARLILGILFVFITSPVAGHLISRSAYYSGVQLWEHSVQDELKPVVEKKKKAAAEAE